MGMFYVLMTFVDFQQNTRGIIKSIFHNNCIAQSLNMRENANIKIIGSKVILIPYEECHVEKYVYSIARIIIGAHVTFNKLNCLQIPCMDVK